MKHKFYSQRNGLERHPGGLPLEKVVGLFSQLFTQLEASGYFQQAFGIDCTDGFIAGEVANPEMDILLSISKDQLWPISKYATRYSEDDLFDMVEYCINMSHSLKKDNIMTGINAVTTIPASIAI